MFKLSKMADYAVLVLTRLGSRNADQGEGLLMSASELAEVLNLSETTIAKVLQYLARGELVSAVRGAQGGYGLTRPLEAISVGDVVRAMDGPIAVAACVDMHGTDNKCCHLDSSCSLKGGWDDLNAQMINLLGSYPISRLSSMNNEVRHGR